MKHFNQEIFDLKDLRSETLPSGRHYTTPEGRVYPSVTTVLSAMSDTSGLDKWRARVGTEEAARISKQATDRGSQLHEACERYLANQDPAPATLKASMLFDQIRPILDQRVDNVHVIEGAVYSDALRLAGRVDCVATYNGQPTIIDFKTASKAKREQWIQNYYHQCALYAFMLWERGLKVTKAAIIIAVEDEPMAQVFEKKLVHVMPEAIDIVRRYHSGTRP